MNRFSTKPRAFIQYYGERTRVVGFKLHKLPNKWQLCLGWLPGPPSDAMSWSQWPCLQQHMDDGRQAVGGAGGVGHHVVVRLVVLRVVHATDLAVLNIDPVTFKGRFQMSEHESPLQPCGHQTPSNSSMNSLSYKCAFPSGISSHVWWHQRLYPKQNPMIIPSLSH